MSAIHKSAEWFRLTRKLRPQFEAQLPLMCINGKGRCVIQPGQAFHLAHIKDAALFPELALDPNNIGISCPRHNMQDGGRAGAKKTNQARRRKEKGEYPTWLQ